MSRKIRIPNITAEKIQKDFKVTWCKKIATVEHLHTNKKMCIQMGQIKIIDDTCSVTEKDSRRHRCSLTQVLLGKIIYNKNEYLITLLSKMFFFK